MPNSRYLRADGRKFEAIGLRMHFTLDLVSLTPGQFQGSC